MKDKDKIVTDQVREADEEGLRLERDDAEGEVRGFGGEDDQQDNENAAEQLTKGLTRFHSFLKRNPTQTIHFKGKLVILGDIGVGKTALVVRCQENRFAQGLKTTIGVAFSQVSVNIDGAFVNFDVWDSAGEERFRSINSLYYHGSAAGIVVYDVTKRSSFESVKSYWIPHLREHGVDGIIIALVGNKADLGHIRQVSREEAQALALEEDIIYFETSAKTGKGVLNVFQGIASLVPKTVAMNEKREDEYGNFEGFRITKIEGKERPGSTSGIRLRLDENPSSNGGYCC